MTEITARRDAAGPSMPQVGRKRSDRPAMNVWLWVYLICGIGWGAYYQSAWWNWDNLPALVAHFAGSLAVVPGLFHLWAIRRRWQRTRRPAREG